MRCRRVHFTRNLSIGTKSRQFLPSQRSTNGRVSILPDGSIGFAVPMPAKQTMKAAVQETRPGFLPFWCEATRRQNTNSAEFPSGLIEGAPFLVSDVSKHSKAAILATHGVESGA
jgi:hypothetical protein